MHPLRVHGATCALLALAVLYDPGEVQAQATTHRALGAPAQTLDAREQGHTWRRRRPGTHFLLEVAGGASLSDEPGPTGGLLLGVGAKLSGSPFRCYGLIGALGSGVALDRGNARRRRGDLLLAAGLRLYVSLLPGMRLYGEVLGGGQHAWDRLTPARGRTLTMKRFVPELRVGTGVQLRLLRLLSLGAGVQYRGFADALDKPSRAQGLTALTHWVGHATATIHF